jgi:glycosyltransferase involved in cell wall biosynthesis
VPQLRLLVLAPYFPPHVGGLEGYASELNEALLATGEVAAITVLAPRLPADGAPFEDRGGGYAIVRYPAFELIPNFPVPMLWKRSFWRALRAADPAAHEVLVSHTRFFLTSTLALLCARAVSRPLLHIEHGSDYVQLDSRPARLAARIYDLTLGRWLLRHADGVVAISRAAADFVRRLAAREVPVIYRGIRAQDLQGVRADERVQGWAGARTLVTFAGRLIDGKGVADLLSAVAALAAPGCATCIVGDGPRRAQLELLAGELGISERTLFLGYLPEAETWSVMRASDVIVNPSYTEGLPTSVLEAALMGKAVVATDVGGTGEIIGDGRGGLLVKPRDIEGLREALARLAADPGLRATLGAGARAEASGRFAWDASARSFLALARALRRAPGADAGQIVAAGEAASTSSNTDS